MKTYKHVFEKMLEEDNIRQCFLDAAKRKTNRPEVARVIKPERDQDDDSLKPGCLQEHVKALQKLLEEEKFRPPKHQKKLINEYTCGKVREIIKPVYQYEQVVHHCIIKQLAPIIMKGMYEHAMGSIPDRGVHSGKKQIEKWIRGYKGKKFYVLKADVRHCFDTEDVRVIERDLKRIIKDDRFIRLCTVVMESEATEKGMDEDADWIRDWTDEKFLSGLPLGFVTSQWFTQLNFRKFDHKVMEEWNKEGGVDQYTRYADDLVAFGRNKRKLHRLREKMEEYLQTEMHQHLKYNWQVFRFEYKDRKTGRVRGRALDFMGFVFHYNRTTMRKTILKRSRRKAAKIGKKEKVNWYDASQMLSSMGWYDHTDTYAYYEKYIKPHVNVKKLKKIVSRHAKKEVQRNGVRMVQSRKPGAAGRMGHDFKP